MLFQGIDVLRLLVPILKFFRSIGPVYGWALISPILRLIPRGLFHAMEQAMGQNLEQSAHDAIAVGMDQRIQDESLDLPMLPKVATLVLELVNDVDSDMVTLAKLIQTDPALAGHVMRIANSAAFSTAVKMSSLQQAISRLGMRNVADIALAASMGPALFNAPGFEEDIH